MQRHAYMVRTQARRLRYFLVAEILEEQDDQRLLRFVELADGFIQPRQPPIIRFLRLLGRLNVPREIAGPECGRAAVARRVLPDKTDRGVERHAIKPRSGISAFLQSRQRAPDLEKNFLIEIIAVRRSEEHTSE